MTTSLGSYELGEVLGRGAMGKVHLAERRGSGERLAVKVLRSELAEDPEVVARFLQERSILVGLDHPGLVRIRDLVVESGSAAVVMDLVDGGDLRRLLTDGGPMAPARAVSIIKEVLEALSVVHGAGIVHRDVKPENVLLDGSGTVRLSDFGIARILGGPSLTKFTGVIGTPEYLAPEAAERDEASAASDVYSVGIMLYELVTGHTPFGGGHAIAVLRRQVDEPPPRPAGIPTALWSFIEELLSKEPSSRPTASAAASHCAELAIELQGLAPLLPSGTQLPTAESAVKPGTARGRRSRSMRSRTQAPTVLRGQNGTSVGRTERRTVHRPKPSPEQVEAPSAIRTRRRLVLVVSMVLALVAVGVGVYVSQGSKGTAHPSQRYTFAPAKVSSGLIVNRTWTLETSTSPILHETLRLTNGNGSSVTSTFDEVIPKSIAASTDKISFSPPPSRIVRADPVVAYEISGLVSGASQTFTYSVSLADKGKPRLKSLFADQFSESAELKVLAHDQIVAQTAYLNSTGQAVPTTLVSLALSPTSLSLTVGDVQVIHLHGVMSDGAPASSVALAGVSWTSTNSRVATISGGMVTGISAGTTAITARVGSRSVVTEVTVADSRSASQSQPGVPASTTSTTMATTTSPPVKLSVTPMELDFGSVPLGTTSNPMYVTVTNLGSDTIPCEYSGGVPAPFEISVLCTGPLGPGQSCELEFWFGPMTLGPVSVDFSGDWLGDNTGRDEQPFNILLTGTGTAVSS